MSRSNGDGVFRGWRCLIVAGTLIGLSSAAAGLESTRLTDVVSSNGVGLIDLFRDVTAQQLESFRQENDGKLVFGVDVNEAANGTEKASSQGVAVGSAVLTVTYSNNTMRSYDLSSGQITTETQALLAAGRSVQRTPWFTLLGQAGSSRITSQNSIQGAFDSTLKISVDQSFYAPEQGLVAVSAVLDLRWLGVNASLGDPETFYDFSGGYEDLALLNETDTVFLDSYAAGRTEAIAVVLTNPEPVVDPLAVESWHYFPSATSYYLVAYEDKFPERGDYDFNDLTVAYQVRLGLNHYGDVAKIRGTAYLVTRGASYNHDWHLRFVLPASATTTLSCTTYLDAADPQLTQPCSNELTAQSSGTRDVVVFSRTKDIFAEPAGGLFVNTLPEQSFVRGPKSEFELALAAALRPGAIAAAPFDPYLHVIATGRNIQLLQVNSAIRDRDGFPFSMLLPDDWLPPLESGNIETAYPLMGDFVASKGMRNNDWYRTFYPPLVINAPVPSRPLWEW